MMFFQLRQDHRDQAFEAGLELHSALDVLPDLITQHRGEIFTQVHASADQSHSQFDHRVSTLLSIRFFDQNSEDLLEISRRKSMNKGPHSRIELPRQN